MIARWVLDVALPVLGCGVFVRRLRPLWKAAAANAWPRSTTDEASVTHNERGADTHLARWPRVSVVIPARNEAHNLPALLSSLARLDPAPAEIIVVDDHSSDGTGDCARAAGAVVIVPPPLPAGWLGKPWACAAGAARATSDLLLFTDADTMHAPESLACAVAALEARRADLVSIVPTHAVVRAWENAQALFQLLLLIATNAGADVVAAISDPSSSGRAPRARRDFNRRFCIGQYLLFRRSAYDALGGHAFVRAHVAEDLVFASAARERYALVVAPGLLRVRMYPEGLGAFLRGWRRNFREGMRATGFSAVLESALVVAGLGAPIAGLARGLGGVTPASVAWSCVAWLAVAAMVATLTPLVLARRSRWSALWALAYPTSLLAFALVSLLAIFDRLRQAPVVWRGRSVDARALSPRF